MTVLNCNAHFSRRTLSRNTPPKPQATPIHLVIAKTTYLQDEIVRLVDLAATPPNSAPRSANTNTSIDGRHDLRLK
jgi:hypothetical protein